MMALKHYVIAFPDSDRLHEVLDRTYNVTVSPHDVGGQCYRKSFVVAKTAADASALRRVADIDSLVDQPAPAPVPEVLETLFSALEEHATVGKSIPGLRESIARLEREKAADEATIADIRATVARLDAQLEERTGQVHERNASLNALGLELEAIRHSTGYRLLRAYRRGARRAFPANSPLGAVHRALVWPLRRILDAGADVKRRDKRRG
jgi:hypothetical protein